MEAITALATQLLQYMAEECPAMHACRTSSTRRDRAQDLGAAIKHLI